MKSSASNIQVTRFDDLFQTGDAVEPGPNQAQEIPLAELFPFKGHPFQVREDDAMRKMVESIAECGVLSAGIARPRPEGGYELLAGHRRKRGSELAGRTMHRFGVAQNVGRDLLKAILKISNNQHNGTSQRNR